MSEEKIDVEINKVKDILFKLYNKAGVQRIEAEVLIDTLLDAELRGIKSHGLIRVKPYYERILKRAVEIPTKMEKLNDKNAICTYDGKNGLGQFIAFQCINEAIKKAEIFGVGAVAVKNSNHFGTAGYYAKLAADKNMVGLVFTNASPRLAPWGGNEKLFGNNPWSVSFPTHDSNIPFVLDISNSVTSAGKIRNSFKRSEEIPLNWALDEHGEMTTDPEEALKGILLPFGQHKGYGITFAISTLTALLSGGVFDSEVNSVDNKNKPQQVSHFFIAINIESFQPIVSFKNRIAETIQSVHQCKLAPGVDRVYYPGERGFTEKIKGLKAGKVIVNKKAWNDVSNLAENQ